MSDSHSEFVQPLGLEEIDESTAVDSIDLLVYDILISRLDFLKNETTGELEHLKNRQKEVSELHDLIAKINSLTDKDGKVKVDPELFALLNKAITNNENSAELNEGKINPENLKILEEGKIYKSEDRQRLIENIRMHIDDLNTTNDMQLQTITQLTNERYETYQMARAIFKPMDEDKKNKARAIAGR